MAFVKTLISSVGKPCEQSQPHLIESLLRPCSLLVGFHSFADHYNHFAKEILIVPFGGSDGKASARNVGDPGSIPGSGRSLEKEMATHSSILAWRIPWMEEPGRLQSTGVAKSRTRLSYFTFTFSILTLCSKAIATPEVKPRSGAPRASFPPPLSLQSVCEECPCLGHFSNTFPYLNSSDREAQKTDWYVLVRWINICKTL